MTHHYINKKGFTLAEVLITLGIIGVIAALTMPAVVANYKKQQALQQLKKVYSVLSQAFNHAVADYGDSSEWDTITPDNAQSYFDTYWKPYLKAPVRCYSYKECMYDKLTPFWGTNRQNDSYCIHPDSGMVANSRVMLHLNDGTFVMIITSSGYGNDDRRILVDLNGAKLPNRFGNDVFFFLRVNGKGIVPYGHDKTAQEVSRDCSINGAGYMCAAKIIKAGWQMEKNYPF
jgi:prepilin-type cleavage/methylation N-terminal domain protein